MCCSFTVIQGAHAEISTDASNLKLERDNYRCVHYPSAMSPDGIGYVSDVDGIKVFVIA
jgi:hypothetical protein